MLQRIIYLSLLCFFLMTSGGSAQERKDEWRENNFSFASLKTVTYTVVLDKDVRFEELDRKKFNDMLTRNLAAEKPLGVNFLSQEELLQRLAKDAELQYLKENEPENYPKVMQDKIDKAASAQMEILVRQWGYQKVFVPEKTETYTDYQNTPVSVIETDSNGNSRTVTNWVQVPVTLTRIVPAHYEEIAQAGLEVSLKQAGQKVWIFLDLRDAPSTKAPIDMTERIVKRCLERLTELRK